MESLAAAFDAGLPTLSPLIVWAAPRKCAGWEEDAEFEGFGFAASFSAAS